MTISSQVNKVIRIGNGTARTFSFSPMVLYANTELQVITRVIATGVETVRTLGTGSTNYSINIAANGYPATGSIEFPATGGTLLPTTEQIIMRRVLLLEQATNLRNQGAYSPPVQEEQFDKIIALLQQHQEEIDRAIKVPVGTPVNLIGDTGPAVTGNRYPRLNSALTAWELVEGAPGAISTPVAVADGGTAGITAIAARGNLYAYPDNNVKDSGALGDNSTDDTAAFHTARDAAGANGEIYVPDGTYLVTGLTLSVADQRWVLSKEAVIRLSNSQNTHVIQITAAGVEIVGGSIDGNRSNQSSGTLRGISVSNVANVRIRGVSVYAVRSYGIYATLIFDNLEITDCDVTDTGSNAIFCELSGGDVDNVVIARNRIDRVAEGGSLTEGGIKVRSSVNGNRLIGFKIIDNYVLMPVSPGAGANICIEAWQTDQLLCEGNQTYGGSMGISVANTQHARIVNNTIYDAGTYGIEITNVGDGVLAANNDIDGNANSTNGIIISGATLPDTCTLANNNIYDTTNNSIHVNGGRGHQFLGNSILQSAAGYCYNLADCTDFVILGGELDGTGGGLKGIMLDGTEDGIILGVEMRTFTEHGILIFENGANERDQIAIGFCRFESVTSPIGTSLSGGGTIGSQVRAFGNIGSSQYETLDLLNNIERIWGSGHPEDTTDGIAGVGSLYQRRDPGAGSCPLYVKETGANVNAGWVPVKALGDLLLETDFLGDTLDGNLWNATAGSGTGNTATMSAGAGGRFNLLTSSADAGIAANGSGISSAALNWRADQGGLEMEVRLQIDDITNVMFFVGFTDVESTTVEAPIFKTSGADTIDSDAANACGICFDTDGTTDEFFHGGVAAGTDTAAVHSGSAPVNATYVILRVTVTSAGAVRGYINGTAVGAATASAITTTTPLCPIVFVANRSAAARNLLIDYIWARANR